MAVGLLSLKVSPLVTNSDRLRDKSVCRIKMSLKVSPLVSVSDRFSDKQNHQSKNLLIYSAYPFRSIL
jgi:hypothetical protein